MRKKRKLIKIRRKSIWFFKYITNYCQQKVNRSSKSLFESRIYLFKDLSTLWLSFSSKIWLPKIHVLTNTSSGNSANCGEMLFKSIKKEIRSTEYYWKCKKKKMLNWLDFKRTCTKRLNAVKSLFIKVTQA